MNFQFEKAYQSTTESRDQSLADCETRRTNRTNEFHYQGFLERSRNQNIAGRSQGPVIMKSHQKINKNKAKSAQLHIHYFQQTPQPRSSKEQKASTSSFLKEGRYYERTLIVKYYMHLPAEGAVR